VKIPSVELESERQTDRQTDMTKPIVAFSSFTNTPKNALCGADHVHPSVSALVSAAKTLCQISMIFGAGVLYKMASYVCFVKSDRNRNTLLRCVTEFLPVLPTFFVRF